MKKQNVGPLLPGKNGLIRDGWTKFVTSYGSYRRFEVKKGCLHLIQMDTILRNQMINHRLIKTNDPALVAVAGIIAELTFPSRDFEVTDVTRELVFNNAAAWLASRHKTIPLFKSVWKWSQENSKKEKSLQKEVSFGDLKKKLRQKARRRIDFLLKKYFTPDYLESNGVIPPVWHEEKTATDEPKPESETATS